MIPSSDKREVCVTRQWTTRRRQLWWGGGRSAPGTSPGPGQSVGHHSCPHHWHSVYIGAHNSSLSLSSLLSLYTCLCFQFFSVQSTSYYSFALHYLQVFFDLRVSLFLSYQYLSCIFMAPVVCILLPPSHNLSSHLHSLPISLPLTPAVISLPPQFFRDVLPTCLYSGHLRCLTLERDICLTSHSLCLPLPTHGKRITHLRSSVIYSSHSFTLIIPL